MHRTWMWSLLFALSIPLATGCDRGDDDDDAQPTDSAPDPLTPREQDERITQPFSSADIRTERGNIVVQTGYADLGCTALTVSDCTTDGLFCEVIDDVLVVREHCADPTSNTCITDVVVTVPPATPTRTVSDEGDITVSDLHGALEFDLGSGDLTLDALSGPVRGEGGDSSNTITATAMGGLTVELDTRAIVLQWEQLRRPSDLFIKNLVPRAEISLQVPSGAYDTTFLGGNAGSLVIEGITDDPDSPDSLYINATGNADIVVEGNDGGEPEIQPQGCIIEPIPGTITERGVGNPTVAYDADNEQLVLFFETQLGDKDDTCPKGTWGIGRATSTDGETWIVDEEPVISPEEGTWFGCIAAQPAVVYDGDTWYLFYKGEQGKGVCDDGTEPPWGCKDIVGLGLATGTQSTDLTPDAEPFFVNNRIGFPSAVLTDDVFQLYTAFQEGDVFNLNRLTSDDFGVSWSQPQIVLEPGFADWARDEIYNPAITCDEDPQLPLVNFGGGRRVTDGQFGKLIEAAGLGVGTSVDGIDWTWSDESPLLEWGPEEIGVSDWRHWDILREGVSFTFFYSERNDDSLNHICVADLRYASTRTRVASPGLAVNKVCGAGEPPPQPPEPPLPPDCD